MQSDFVDKFKADNQILIIESEAYEIIVRWLEILFQRRQMFFWKYV